ncbi:hypothetical protein HOD29_01290 [archaeon]|jgi:replication factor A1|nr:hypothetical protein [archaeon]
MNGSYDKILSKLSEVSGIEGPEIDRRVEAKRAKLSGLISREGALQVIAAELGVSFDNEKLKIDELLPGMRKVHFVGKIITLYPVRTFTTKDGSEGKVANMIVADDTSNIKVVLWDTNHIALLEKGEIGEGKVIEVKSGSMRDNEVHMGSFSELNLSTEIFEEVKTEKPIKEKEIKDFIVGEKINTRAFIVQSFEPRFFEASKETGRKITEEEVSKGVESEKKAILNVVIDDGTESIRAVLFHEKVKELGLTAYDSPELMEQQRQEALGREINFIGNVKMNSYFNNPELIVDHLEDVNVDKLVESLEA